MTLLLAARARSHVVLTADGWGTDTHRGVRTNKTDSLQKVWTQGSSLRSQPWAKGRKSFGVVIGRTSNTNIAFPNAIESAGSYGIAVNRKRFPLR